MFVVGLGNQTQRVIAECKLGVTKERFVGGTDESPGDFQNRLGGSGLDAFGQFLGFGFLFGTQWFRHDRLLQRDFPTTL
jgi:hypothetical protein